MKEASKFIYPVSFALQLVGNGYEGGRHIEVAGYITRHAHGKPLGHVTFEDLLQHFKDDSELCQAITLAAAQIISHHCKPKGKQDE